MAIKFVNVWAAATFAFTSWGAVVLNKILISNYGFSFPITMIFVQIIINLCILLTLKYFRITEVHFPTSAQVQKNWMLSLVFLGSTIFGVTSLTRVNLAMFVVLRRMGVIFTIGMERWILDTHHSAQVFMSLAIMIIGTIIAGYADLQFDLWGYTVIMITNALQTLYQVMNLKVAKDSKMDNLSLMMLQSLLNLPVCFLLAMTEWTALFPKLPSYQTVFWVVLGASSSWIFLLNYCTLNCTRVNSVLTTNVIGQLKNLLIIVASYIWWASDTPIDKNNILGISVAIVGSFYYMYLTFGSEKAVAPPKPTEDSKKEKGKEEDKEKLIGNGNSSAAESSNGMEKKEDIEAGLKR